MKFYFDYVSPYAYLAWTQIHALAARHRREVEPVPILFAALLDEHGQKGPAEIPAKRAYLFKDVYRTARARKVPLAPPASHPFNPLLPLRATCADLAPDERRALVDGIFAATWARGEDVTDPPVIARIGQAAGLNGDQLVEYAGSQSAKDRLKRNTKDAISAGVFGVPTVHVAGELFWGLDAFPHLEAHLRGEGTVPDDVLARFLAVRGVTRRR